MNEFVTAFSTGIAAFTATNLDDLVILTLLFSQVNATFRHRHIVIGQYLGFCTLVIASLVGFLGGLVLPPHLIGLLGLVPITVGLNRLLNKESDSQTQPELSTSSSLISFLSPQAYSVAAITIANGSDNVSIYMPLFANSTLSSLLVIIAVFLLLVGVWCYVTYKLTCQPAISNLLTRYGNGFVPFVLIGLGVFIILDGASLTPIALTASCLCLAGLVKLYTMNGQVATSSSVEIRG
ncbi:cadmium resistance transporter [Desmonostoc muscorum CCALA 125]|uniref:Cadmium resistance transporter n=1 Tax=Desmonostoc muscorum LEGE 12446 TaxID=1828758 RepID=A0A8J6ZLB2_DESMC|nr:cadmium resistance transporter [Desmonostoc muscorum]MBX9253682.1 cadmium resistance transporter [Desmonostoc muscorum CCALA 125]MCF2145779.1 cadmium resistance transporter [Desmonostoc muscorum LEGE 12446]